MIGSNVKRDLIDRYKISAQDTGSVEVQIAMLTEQIKVLTEHCKVNKKDFSSKRGLLKMVGKRKRFLKYLQRRSPQKYQELVAGVGLRA